MLTTTTATSVDNSANRLHLGRTLVHFHHHAIYLELSRGGVQLDPTAMFVFKLNALHIKTPLVALYRHTVYLEPYHSISQVFIQGDFKPIPTVNSNPSDL